MPFLYKRAETTYPQRVLITPPVVGPSQGFVNPSSSIYTVWANVLVTWAAPTWKLPYDFPRATRFVNVTGQQSGWLDARLGWAGHLAFVTGCCCGNRAPPELRDDISVHLLPATGTSQPPTSAFTTTGLMSI